MEDNDEFKIGSFGLLVIYIVISTVLGVIITGISITLLKETNLLVTITQGQDDRLLILSCIVMSINVILSTLVFWILIRRFISIDKLTIEKFIKNTVIILTFLGVSSIIINLYNGYNNWI